VDAAPDKSCTRERSSDRAAGSFPAWKEARQAASLPGETQVADRREMLAFLHHCTVERGPATIMLAKQYLAEKERQGANGARPALRWFFQSARKRGSVVDQGTEKQAPRGIRRPRRLRPQGGLHRGSELPRLTLINSNRLTRSGPHPGAVFYFSSFICQVRPRLPRPPAAHCSSRHRPRKTSSAKSPPRSAPWSRQASGPRRGGRGAGVRRDRESCTRR
jgi:hypothetical protein